MRTRGAGAVRGVVVLALVMLAAAPARTDGVGEAFRAMAEDLAGLRRVRNAWAKRLPPARRRAGAGPTPRAASGCLFLGEGDGQPAREGVVAPAPLVKRDVKPFRVLRHESQGFDDRASLPVEMDPQVLLALDGPDQVDGKDGVGAACGRAALGHAAQRGFLIIRLSVTGRADGALEDVVLDGRVDREGVRPRERAAARALRLEGDGAAQLRAVERQVVLHARCRPPGPCPVFGRERQFGHGSVPDRGLQGHVPLPARVAFHQVPRPQRQVGLLLRGRGEGAAHGLAGEFLAVVEE